MKLHLVLVQVDYTYCILFCLFAVAIFSCKPNNTATNKAAMEVALSLNDSMQRVSELPIQVGATIENLPTTIIEREASYDLSNGNDMYIFIGPDKRLGGEFYVDSNDSTKIGQIHILNPYLVSDDGVYPGRKEGTVEARTLDFVNEKSTYRIDFPAKQMRVFNNDINKLKVTRMIYR